jgi:hypothetical protein
MAIPEKSCAVEGRPNPGSPAAAQTHGATRTNASVASSFAVILFISNTSLSIYLSLYVNSLVNFSSISAFSPIY